MDVRWLEVFQQVAAQGSVSAAARKLRYTQSAISRQIAALEAEVGHTLFDRLPRGVRLTAHGHALLPHAEAVSRRLADARADLAALTHTSGGRLRLGAFPTAGAVLLPTAIATFRRSHPAVAISVTEGRTRRQLDRLTGGESDLAVVSAYPHAPIDEDLFDLEHLCADPMVVALPADHRYAGRPAVTLSELADESWVAGSANAEETLFSACLASGFRPRIDIVAAEWTAKQGFVAAGLGITLIPSLAAGTVRADLVLVALAGDALPVRTISIATPRGISDSPAVTAFRRVIHGTVENIEE